MPGSAASSGPGRPRYSSGDAEAGVVPGFGQGLGHDVGFERPGPGEALPAVDHDPDADAFDVLRRQRLDLAAEDLDLRSLGAGGVGLDLLAGPGFPGDLADQRHQRLRQAPAVPPTVIFGDPDGGLAGRDRDALPVLPAGAGPGVEVGADGVDGQQRLGAVADEVGGPDRSGEPPVLDEVGLGHAEDEVAGGGVDLTAAEGGAVQAVGGGGDDVVGVGLAGQQVGVGHPDHRERLVGLPPAVAARLPALLAGPEEIPHVVVEDAALDERVVPGGMALVVDGQGAPAPVEGAVVDQRHERGGDLGADPAPEDRGVPVDEVGLEAVAAGLVEEDAAGALAEHHRQLPARRRPGVEHPQRPLGGRAGHLLGVELVEQLEADGVAGALEAGLEAAVAQRRAADHEPGADPVVFHQQPVGVGDQHPLAGVGVGGRHLADGAAGGPGGVVGPAQDLGLAELLHRLGQLPDRREPGPPGLRRPPRWCAPRPPRAAAPAARAASVRDRSDRSEVWA